MMSDPVRCQWCGALLPTPNEKDPLYRWCSREHQREAHKASRTLAKSVANMILTSPQIVDTATRMADLEEAILSSPRIMAFGKQVEDVEKAILSSPELAGFGDWIINTLPRLRSSFEHGWIQDVLSEIEVDLVPIPDIALPDPGAEERELADAPILSAKDRWIILVLGGAILYSILIRMHGLGQLESMGRETIELTVFLLETLKTLADEIPALGGLLVFFAIAGGVKTLKTTKNE